MGSTVNFPELGDLLFATGLSLNALSKATGVSRNTLAAMRDGKAVSKNSVAKLLANLERQYASEVRQFRAILQRKTATQSVQLASVHGSVALAVDNTAARNSKTIAADLCACLEECAGFAAELANAARLGDVEIDSDDPRHIQRFHRRLEADLTEFYHQFSTYLTQ